MPRACLLIRQDIPARFNAYAAGLKRCGYDVVTELTHPNAGDVLIIWNRHRHASHARHFEAAGARVIVSENGFIGRAPDGGKMFALCLGHHNGAGQWTTGEEDRWSKLGIDLQPWRRKGEHILVLAQRGIGEPGVAMPRAWLQTIVARLHSMTQRQIIVRHHPGIHNNPPEPDWRGCWAAVTWGSGAGVKAIVAGVPVFYEFDRWIGAAAAKFGIEPIEDPFLGDRLPMLRRLAWAQWSLTEIASGDPFARLLDQ